MNKSLLMVPAILLAGLAVSPAYAAPATSLKELVVGSGANTGQPMATSDVQAAFQRMLDYRAAETTAPQQATPTPLPLRDSLTAVLWSKTTDANNSRGNR